MNVSRGSRYSTQRTEKQDKKNGIDDRRKGSRKNEKRR
jgi:hypothetical protein